MKSLIKNTILCLALALGCDPQDDHVEFRNGEPEILYLSQFEAEIGLAEFAEIVLACDNIEKPKLAVTWTAYPPAVTGAGPRVLGLGFSTMAEDPLIDCYRDLMLELGAHP